MARSIIIVLTLFLSLTMNAEPLEKEKVKYLVEYLIEQGELKRNEFNENVEGLVEITDVLYHKRYSADFRVMKFKIKGCEDRRNYVFIESKTRFEVFDLCNAGPFYTGLFDFLKEYSSNLSKEQLLDLLIEISNGIDRVSSPAGVRNDGRFKSSVTCF